MIASRYFTKSVMACILAASSTFAAVSCSNVARTSLNNVVDYSGDWNDTDARLVSEDLVKQAFGSVWMASAGTRPTMTSGYFKNMTMEHIDTDIVANKIRNTLINSGKVRYMSPGDMRDATQAERLRQSKESDPETAKSLAKEIGAKYLFLAQMNSVTDQKVSGTEQVRLYQVTATILEVETGEIVWSGMSEQKKLVRRARVKW